MNRVFVYGTLKRGQRNFAFLRGSKFYGRHVTESIYSMYEFENYPAVCRDGIHSISGEVYGVSDRRFRTLDVLEWYPRMYQRIEIPTAWGKAWMYVVKSELCHGRTLLDGTWP